MYNLDFSQLKRFDRRSLFMSLDDDIDSILGLTLPETAARIKNATRFCWYVAETKETLFADEPRATRLREGFLRASLAEFVSIEETLKRDISRLDGELSPIKLTDFENPLIHLMRELRNLEIHLSSSELVSSKIQIVFVGEKHESTIWTISDLSVQKFDTLNNAKKYSQADKQKMIDWFNEAQLDWGVTDLLFRSICEVAERLVSNYSLNKYRS